MTRKLIEPEITKGEWGITTCMDYWIEHNQPLTEEDRDFSGVAHCGDISWPNFEKHQKTWETNARFIAAAPRVARALVQARLWLGSKEERQSSTIDFHTQLLEEIDAALLAAGFKEDAQP